METFLVSNDLDCHKNARFVVDTSDNLTKASFTKEVNHLVSIRKVITIDDVVVTTFVIIAEIGRGGV